MRGPDSHMENAVFAELLESAREGGAIQRGERPASRTLAVESPDVRGVRERFDLSRSEFAGLLGVSVKTLQKWEQGRLSSGERTRLTTSPPVSPPPPSPSRAPLQQLARPRSPRPANAGE